MSNKQAKKYIQITTDTLDDHLNGLEKASTERHVTNRKLAILSDFEYARKNDKEAFWYGPWSRVLEGFLCPIYVTPNKSTRIEARPFAQHPVSADALDLDEYLKDAVPANISLASTRYVDLMVVVLSHLNKLQGTTVPLSRSHPDPRIVLGVELKNPERLGTRSQSPPALKAYFSSVCDNQVMDQANHVFNSYRLRKDRAWMPQVYLSIIICGEWMTYMEITPQRIEGIKGAMEAAEAAREEEREGSTYGDAPPVAKGKSKKSTVAGGAQAPRIAAHTPPGSGPNKSNTGKVKVEDLSDSELEDWSADYTKGRDSGGEDESDEGTWTVGSGPTARKRLLEIFTPDNECRPVELMGSSGWEALSLIARRLTEPDVSGDIFPVGGKVMTKYRFDAYEESNLIKAWLTKLIDQSDTKEARKGR